MSIPVVLVWGQRDSLGRLGWTARRCSRCGRAQAFECHRRTRAHHLYFVEYKAEDVGHIVVCDVCDGADALGTNEEPRVDKAWPRQALEALVKSMDPSLLPVEPRTSLSEAEVLAILRVADERGKALGKDVTAPFLVGAIPGGILIAAVMAALSEVGFLPRSADTVAGRFSACSWEGLPPGSSWPSAWATGPHSKRCGRPSTARPRGIGFRGAPCAPRLERARPGWRTRSEP